MVQAAISHRPRQACHSRIQSQELPQITNAIILPEKSLFIDTQPNCLMSGHFCEVRMPCSLQRLMQGK